MHYSVLFSLRRTLRSSSQWRTSLLYLALLTVSFGLCVMVYLFFPELRPQLTLENSVIENLSVAFYLIGCIILSAGLFSRTRRFKGAALLATLCFIGVVEEISYGEQLLDFTAPVLPNGVEIDALHDINQVMVVEFGRLGLPWYGGFLSGVLLLAALALWLLRRQLHVIFRALTTPRSPWAYVMLAAGLALTALFIDSRVSVPRKWAFLEEVLEMNAALSLAFAAGVGVFLTKKTQENSED